MMIVIGAVLLVSGLAMMVALRDHLRLVLLLRRWPDENDLIAYLAHRRRMSSEPSPRPRRAEDALFARAIATRVGAGAAGVALLAGIVLTRPEPQPLAPEASRSFDEPRSSSAMPPTRVPAAPNRAEVLASVVESPPATERPAASAAPIASTETTRSAPDPEPAPVDAPPAVAPAPAAPVPPAAAPIPPPVAQPFVAPKPVPVRAPAAPSPPAEPTATQAEPPAEEPAASPTPSPEAPAPPPTPDPEPTAEPVVAVDEEVAGQPVSVVVEETGEGEVTAGPVTTASPPILGG